MKVLSLPWTRTLTPSRLIKLTASPQGHQSPWSVISLRSGTDSDGCCPPDSHTAYFDPIPALLCEHHFWRWWTHRMGRHRDHLVLLLCVYRRLVPVVGEPRRP